jgi:DNA-binding response OmpR family regulator
LIRAHPGSRRSKETAAFLAKGLLEAGFDVQVAHDGEAGFKKPAVNSTF